MHNVVRPGKEHFAIVLAMNKIVSAEDGVLSFEVATNEKFSINSISKGRPDEGDASFCVTSNRRIIIIIIMLMEKCIRSANGY